MKRTPNVSRWLESHATDLTACRLCGHQGVVPIVSRPASPRAMLVGQAPGQTEAIDQRPFAGRAGTTLFRWLDSAGLTETRARQTLYIAAITRCYPGASPSGRGDRVPSRREQELCADWLDRELAALRPPLIIPVGRLAIERFLGPRSLEEVVGRAWTLESAGGEATAVPLPHPSGASSWIHQAGHARLVEDAIGLLRDRFRALGMTRADAATRAEAGHE